MPDRLYDLPTYEGQDDYLPPEALARIGAVVIDKLPHRGFDMPSSQASTKTVTATLAFDGCPGPEAQLAALEAVLQGATVLRTLYANLVAARAALDVRYCIECEARHAPDGNCPVVEAS